MNPTPKFRLARPPHAFQSFLLDICTTLVQAASKQHDIRAIIAIGQTAMGMWATLASIGNGREAFGARVLRWWGDFLKVTCQVEQHHQNTHSAQSESTDEGKLHGDLPTDLNHQPAPTILISDTSRPQPPTTPVQQPELIPMPDASIPLASGLLHPLFAHILEAFPIPLSSTDLACVHGFDTLLQLAITSQLDFHIVLLKLVGQGSQTIQLGALSILHTFYPQLSGRLTVSAPFPIVSYDINLARSSTPSEHHLPKTVEHSSLTQDPRDAHMHLEVVVDAIEACLESVDLSVNETGIRLLSKCRFDGEVSRWTVNRLIIASLRWMLDEVCSTLERKMLGS